MALSTARIHRVRGRPPLLAAGIKSLIHSHSSSVRSLGYIFSFIYPFYTTREDFSDRLLEKACQERLVSVSDVVEEALVRFLTPGTDTGDPHTIFQKLLGMEELLTGIIALLHT